MLQIKLIGRDLTRFAVFPPSGGPCEKHGTILKNENDVLSLMSDCELRYSGPFANRDLEPPIGPSVGLEAQATAFSSAEQFARDRFEQTKFLARGNGDDFVVASRSQDVSRLLLVESGVTENVDALSGKFQG